MRASNANTAGMLATATMASDAKAERHLDKGMEAAIKRIITHVETAVERGGSDAKVAHFIAASVKAEMLEIAKEEIQRREGEIREQVVKIVEAEMDTALRAAVATALDELVARTVKRIGGAT